MSQSIFLRFLLAPLVAIGVCLGLATAPMIFPAKARASVASVVLQDPCSATLKNDRLVESLDGSKYAVKVLFTCLAGTGCPCRIHCDYQAFDSDLDPVHAQFGNTITLPCGSASQTVTFSSFDKVWPNQAEGWYFVRYDITVLDCDGEPIYEPLSDGEWYRVGDIGFNGERTITPLSKILFAAASL